MASNPDIFHQKNRYIDNLRPELNIWRTENKLTISRPIEGAHHYANTHVH